MINKDRLYAEIEELLERESNGYEDLGQIVIACADCEERLVVIQVVKDTEDENKFQVPCCFCGGESFIKRVKGKVYLDAVKKLKLEDVEIGDVTIIKVQK